MVLKFETEKKMRKNVASLKNELDREDLKNLLLDFWVPLAGLTVRSETFEQMRTDCTMLIMREISEIAESVEDIHQRMIYLVNDVEDEGDESGWRTSRSCGSYMKNPSHEKVYKNLWKLFYVWYLFSKMWWNEIHEIRSNFNHAEILIMNVYTL